MNGIQKVISKGVVLSALAFLSGNALAATTVSLTAGPIPLPNIPVKACINANCVSTPPLSTVKLTVDASVTLNLSLGSLTSILPTITAAACPNGETGVALDVTTGAAAVTLGGTITGTIENGMTYTQTLAQVTVPPGRHLTISACGS